MEITAAGAMRDIERFLAILPSPDSQIDMEMSISGCRIARFCFFFFLPVHIFYKDGQIANRS